MSVTLIIPALNEAACLATLLVNLPTDYIDQLIVVDNGSDDGTAQVAQRAGATVIVEPRRGYGFACAAGAAAAGGDVLAFMDGDGSFLPLELPGLLVPLAGNAADLVLGSRQQDSSLPAAMPPHQRLGNALFTLLLSWRFGLKLTDLGPFRAIRRDLLSKLEMRERTYGWPLEMIIKTARLNRPIVEIPVTYRPRVAGQSKVGGTFRGSVLTAYRFLSVALRYSL
jgi:glycosyltransferase involved in cell wall biosynthesis